MKQIPLTQGLFALVDDEDYDYLMQWKWYALKNSKTFYACRYELVNGVHKTIMMHRVLIGATRSFELVDHKDLNGLNNMRENLRQCTGSQNQMNRGPNKNNTVGVRGVYFNNISQKYCASIKVRGRKIHLGSYGILREAAKARQKAEVKYFGEFARTTP